MKNRAVVKYQEGVTPFEDIQEGALLNKGGINEYVLLKTGTHILTGYKKDGKWLTAVYENKEGSCKLKEFDTKVEERAITSKLEKVLGGNEETKIPFIGGGVVKDWGN